jgi:hypothetical protein
MGVLSWSQVVQVSRLLARLGGPHGLAACHFNRACHADPWSRQCSGPLALKNAKR